MSINSIDGDTKSEGRVAVRELKLVRLRKLTIQDKLPFLVAPN